MARPRKHRQNYEHPPTRAQIEAAKKAESYNVKPRKNTASKIAKIIALLTITTVLSVAAFFVLTTNSMITSLVNGLPSPKTAISPDVETTGLELSDDEKDLLNNSGFDANHLTDNLQGFLDAFFTYSPDSLLSGQWADNVFNYIDKNAADTYAENAIKSKLLNENWATSMAEHPSALSNLESIDDVEWYLIENDNGEIEPFCLVTITLTRPVIDTYFLNSPACEVSRFQDSYNVYFTTDENIYRIRRASQLLIEPNIMDELTQLDFEKMEEKRNNEKDAIDYAAIEKKRKEAAAKAAKEAEEKAKKEAEEKKKKEAEEKEKEEQEKKEAEEKAKKEAEEAARAAKEAEEKAKKEAEEAAKAAKEAEEKAKKEAEEKKKKEAEEKEKEEQEEQPEQSEAESTDTEE